MMRSVLRRQPSQQQQTTWQPIKCPPEKLSQAYFDGLQNSYWKGVERDVADILKALRVWNLELEKDGVPPLPNFSEGAKELYGFGSFLSKAASGDSAKM
jgi:hypothetical protein